MTKERGNNMKIWGIDVSKYNYPIDWTKVKNAGVQFAILRVSSYRNMKNPNSIYKDPYFETFYKGAKAVGLPVGCYFYSQCENEVQAKKEANFVLECIKGKQFEYPIWIDVENIHTLQTTTKAQLTNAVITAMDILEKNGYYTGIYTGKYILRDELNDSKLDKYDKWIAQYSSKCTYTGKYNMWQFGGEINYLKNKKIPGIGSDVADQNYCYVDYPSIIKKNGLNGYKKSENTTPTTPAIPTKKENMYKVTSNALNVRSEPSIKDENIVGKLKKDDEVEIVEIKENWGKISLNKWINLKYCKKI